jgi:hypothetical protein
MPSTASLSLPALFVGLTLAGCSAAGASGTPPLDRDLDGDSDPANVPIEPRPSAGSTTPTEPPSLFEPNAPTPSEAAPSCAAVTAQVEHVRHPVDIIITVDNSGSMDDEARAVEENLNVNFAAILEQSGIDYRVILVSEHRERNGQDTAVCVTTPLSSVAACPSEVPGPTDRFFQYAIEVNSHNSLDVLLETYDGRREDDFGLAPGGWSEWLRPGAKKVFLEITDDDSNTPALEFTSALMALSPAQFGADPSRLAFVWHSIVGLAERPVSTDPYEPGDPIETDECAGDVVNAGATYQELSRLTGGLRFPICEFEGYDAVFQRVASDVVLGSRNVCDFAIPSPPPGRALDLDKVAVSYQPGAGGSPLLFGRAPSTADCRGDGFLVDAAGVHLCPEACNVVGSDARAAVSVVFTCQSTLLR